MPDYVPHEQPVDGTSIAIMHLLGFGDDVVKITKVTCIMPYICILDVNLTCDLRFFIEGEVPVPVNAHYAVMKVVVFFDQVVIGKMHNGLMISRRTLVRDIATDKL